MGDHNVTAVPAGHSSQAKDHPTPQLSCELCRERKIKCDKLEPCSNCISAGALCVPVHRLRLPRGRHARRSARTASPGRPGRVRPASTSIAVDEDLNKRIQRLEELVDTMASDIVKPATGSESSGISPTSQGVDNPNLLSAAHKGLNMSTKGISSTTEKQSPAMLQSHHFWADLVAEIHGLRNVMDSALAEADDDIAQAPDPSQVDSVDGGISLLGLSGSSNSPAAPQLFVTSQIASEFCQIYLRQVDPIIKILHRPSLSKLMLEGQQYLGYPDGHASVQAISSAVCYSAATSMTERQCQEMFHMERTRLVADCRKICEAAIERSGLLSTRDISVLQAFVLYLIARRSEDRTRAVSALVAVAVRIAKTLCLHVNPEKEAGRKETFFYQQMRRRLWLTICLMDLQASVFQASETLISAEEAASSLNMPKHINDSDFDPSTTEEVPDSETLTDTTFALVTYLVQMSGRLLNIVEKGKKSIAGDSADGGANAAASPSGASSEWEVRQQQGRRFEEDALALLHFVDPESSPFAWFTWHGVHCFVFGMRLSALRPFQGARANRAPPKHMVDDTEVLRLAIKVLQKAHLMHLDPRGEGFRWYITIPWPALAVALAECYVCADEALVRAAWPVIEACYQYHEAVIARFSGGILQGPLGKMMRQTREKVTPLLQVGDIPSDGRVHKSTTTSAQISPAIPSTQDVIMGDGITSTPSSAQNLLMSFNTQPLATPASSMLSQQDWTMTPPSLEGPTMILSEPPPGDTPFQQDTSDQSWRIWEEFVSGISFDEFANVGMFFDENSVGGQ